jgi:hypothetical protein
MTPPPNPTPLAEEVAREIAKKILLDAWDEWQHGTGSVFLVRRELIDQASERIRAHADEAVREHVSHLERDENWTSYLQRMDELTAALREKEQEIERLKGELNARK